MGKLTLLLLAVLIWLQYSLWFGKNNMHDLIRISNDIKKQKNNNAKLKIRNKQLCYEINELKNGNEAIEERSRRELGMIKSGETFYRLVPRQSK
ncbi:cell division protein FtsB [Candidatus Curculioniphilus buchneri]|uniref:cell division protein FtsB n=1 Tax=Candidatus Curculioniphilus buchneri TaxID=690594 RepID=UPI00376F123A